MAYVRLDKISADAHIESIVATEDLLNGQFVALGELQADGESRAVTPSGDEAEELVFHVSNGVVYGDQENELDFVLKAGKTGRGFVLKRGDVISITTQDGVSGAGTLVVGDKVNPDANGFVRVDGTTVATAGALHGEVLAFENDAIAGQMAVIRIARA